MLRYALAFLLSLIAQRAVAQPSVRPALHWSRGADADACIDPRALALRVTALTGDVLVEPASATLSIEGHVERRERGGFVVRVTSSDGQGRQQGERTLENAGSDCRALDGAIAFVIALLIDPDLALERLPSELVALGAEGPEPDALLLAELERDPPKTPAKQPVREQVPQPLPQPRAAPAEPAKQPRSAAELGANAFVSLRELPKAALGAQLSVAYAIWRAVAFEAQVRALQMVGEDDIDQVRSLVAQSYAGGLAVCPRAQPWRRVFLEACAGAEVRATRMLGRGFSDERDVTLWNAAAQVALGAGIYVHERVAVRARSSLRYSPRTQRYQYETRETRGVAFETSRVSVSLTLGVSVAF